jgi:outer membrane protein assembly factor BamB
MPATWDPGVNDEVRAIAVGGDRVFLGGIFSFARGFAARYLIAVDTVTATRVDWNPTPDWVVSALLLEGSTLYMGGEFGAVGLLARPRLAAVEAASGNVLPWAPTVGGTLRCLASDGHAVYAGGDFDRVVALDPANGIPKAWLPSAQGKTFALVAGSGVVYAGGDYAFTGYVYRAGLVGLSAFGLAPVGVAEIAPKSSLEFASITPTPVRTRAQIRFRLPIAAAVTLTVHDLQGRRVASLLDHEPRTAGDYAMTLDVAGWPAGVYLCRLRTPAGSVTRRLVVAPSRR